MKETDFSLKESQNSYHKQESTDNINCRKKHYLCHISFILYHSTPSGRQSFGSGVSRFFLTFFFGCNSGRSGTSLGRKLIVFTSIIYHNSYSKKPADMRPQDCCLSTPSDHGHICLCSPILPSRLSGCLVNPWSDTIVFSLFDSGCKFTDYILYLTQKIG